MLSKVLILLCIFTCCYGAKILFLTCTPAPSHQKPFQAIWRELAIRGHEVHVLTPNPLRNSSLTNLHEYDLSEYYVIVSKFSQDAQKYVLSKPTFLSAFIKDVFATNIWSGLYNRTLNHPEVERLKSANKHFDLVIVEWLFPTLAAFGAYYQAPLIGITSLGAPTVALDTLGNPQHPLVAPDMNLPLKRDMSFKERLLASLYAVWVRAYYRFVVLPREDINIKASLGKNMPFIGDIERNVSAILMNRNPVFHRALPLFPNIVELGGIQEEKVNPPLESDLKNFVEKSRNGVVYFSLGSSMKSTLLDDTVVSKLQRVFAELPYGFVWKWEGDSMPGKPKNVFISKWIPQVTLLEHPNVRLFITQGGLQSIEEAISAHKPIIGIPFHSDQTTNVDTCVSYGMGKMLDLDELTEENLSSSILDIMNNYSSYAEQAKRLDDLMKDQPQDGLDKAIWWIEYIIRHKGAKHLRSMAADLPWYQYLMLDIYACLVGIALLVILIVYLIFKASLKAVKWVYGKLFVKAKDEKRKSD
ncbi:UDP-glycosyltransferase UGT5-like isoform X2 [Anthonomus grandis grandis]|uniref:UDP-glycosyltransferase UGT5-like isoform X2 n=1 Tax=Anthonomus grandis grandis TaxID=2921223 RepID=UPI0021669B92|nr:UDP-glycosyltransferase UGT5-like isoform X2 [Anthonomus grandis grandis]